MIYFDYSATSLKRKEILKKLIDMGEKLDGNPESSHSLGRSSKKYLEDARRRLSESLGVKPSQLIFTSGASESNNTVINAFSGSENHIISTKGEHPSILEPLKNVKASVSLVDIDKDGSYCLEEIRGLLREDTRLVSLILVNNEIGSVSDLEEIKKLARDLREKNIWLHLDCVQALGHMDLNLTDLACDSASFSGHKLGALNGFGLLYLRENLKPLIRGGDQESKRRAGTSFVMGAVSMADALEASLDEIYKIRTLKLYFLYKLQDSGINYEVNGTSDINHIVNIYFPDFKSDFLLTYLDMKGICLSAGSACTAGSLEPSHVISNMYDEERARRSVRFSFGFDNKKEDIDYLIDEMIKLRGKNEGK